MTGSVKDVPWRPLGRTGVHYWLVQRMAKRCGVDTSNAVARGDIDQDDWVGMVQKCRGCTWTEGCERWLAHLDEDGSVAPPAECINAEILKSLATSQKER